MIDKSIIETLSFEPDLYRADKSAWVGHLPFANFLIRELQPELIVELGTHWGESYFTFCQTIKENNLSAFCYAVDTWQGEAHAGSYDVSVFNFVNEHNEQNYNHFSKLLRTTFDQAVHQFSDASIDLLHIDGLHTYEAVKNDFETWLSKVKAGGVILFHDICCRHEDFGVWKLWEEIKQSYPHTLELQHCHGLGILINSQDDVLAFHPFLKELTAKSQEKSWQQLFSTTGHHIQNSSRLKIQITGYQNDLIQREQSITELQNTNHELQNTNHELQNTNRELQNTNSELQNTNHELQYTNHELQNTNHELLGNIEQKSNEISKLSSEAKHTQTRLTTLENLTNEFWEKDFRSRYLRPLSPLRKLTSRRYPLIERLLPPPKLGIDCITKIKNEPNRITFLKNALDLKLFDSAKYLTEFPKVARKRENPYYHYLSKLWTKDVAPKSSPDIYGYLDACFNPKAQSIQQQPVPATLPREDKPLVSVIVVNFNGLHHLEDLLVSLQKQSYENSEIIVVENASTDGSKTYLAENWTSVKTVALNKNEGFAEGNNIGQEAASGRLVCLLNNDTTVDEQWLEELVEEWRKDNTVGAVCSKVVFWKPYVELKLECLSKDASICVSEASLRSFHPKYAKPIYRNEITRSPADWIICEQNFSTYLPYENADKAELIVRNTSSIAKKIRVSLNDILVLETTLEPGEHCLSLEIPQDKLKPEYIINNAGSELIDTTLEAGDRGIYELDHGQYDEACDLTAICGCSVLVDPISIANHALFCKDFFAYYEDTDLSLRIRRNGFKLRYAPKSKVYHKHASSSKEDSAFFRYHVARNKQYLNMLHAKEGIWKPSLESAKRHLTHMNKYYADNESSEAEKAFGTQIPQLIQDLDTFRDKVLSGTTYHRKNYFKKIAIYNSYWNTAGGGEYHALMFAQYFSKHGMVDLISETDFNLEAVTAQFGLEIKNCRKRITPLVNTQTTEEYDIFVNSTFCSSLISNAPKSYYIISFPHRIDPKNSHYKKFLMSYTFLANSTYTKEWTKRYWNKESEVVYPSINIPDILESKKSNYILNVGRFFEDGHNKKQLELAQAFSEMKREGLISSDWKLVLAGKVQQGHEHYALKIKENFGEDGIQIKDNLSHEELGILYSKAFIYWHATGINEDPNLAPDKFEHFGITTCEALSHACIPVVFKAGGQPEIIKNQVDGYVFSNVNELKTYTADLVKMKEHYPNEILKMQKNAFAKSKDFTRSVFFERLETIYQLKQKPNSTKL